VENVQEVKKDYYLTKKYLSKFNQLAIQLVFQNMNVTLEKEFGYDYEYLKTMSFPGADEPCVPRLPFNSSSVCPQDPNYQSAISWQSKPHVDPDLARSIAANLFYACGSYCVFHIDAPRTRGWAWNEGLQYWFEVERLGPGEDCFKNVSWPAIEVALYHISRLCD